MLGGERWGETGLQSQREHPVCDKSLEPHASARLCRGGGRLVVGLREDHCDLCRTVEGGSDGEVIVLRKMPFATFAPRF